jgi:uncharacterized membrane protein
MVVDKAKPKPDEPHSKLVPAGSLIWTGIILSLLGIVDGIYLTVGHYSTHFVYACPVNSFINCESVTSSSYSIFLGMPVALLGLIFFVVMFFLQLPYAWHLQSKLIRWGRLAFSIAGILMVLRLIYVELHLLNQICLYCTAAHALTFGLFIVTLIATASTSQAKH